jgi:hypothetical protein
LPDTGPPLQAGFVFLGYALRTTIARGDNRSNPWDLTNHRGFARRSDHQRSEAALTIRESAGFKKLVPWD